MSMRKYMSTLAQVIDFSDSQLDWVCRHMGNTREVHLQHYRTMSGFIERVQIGKLLLMQDLNIQNKFTGKKLDEIDFTDIISVKEKLEEETLKEDASQAGSSNQSGKSKRKMTSNEDYEPPTKKSKSKLPQKKSKSKLPQKKSKTKDCELPQKKRKTGRQKWSEMEEKELRMYLGNYLDNCITPGKAECEEAMAKSKENGGELFTLRA